MAVDRSSFWRMLGLAARARMIISGSDAVEIGLRRNKGSLLIMAEDMAGNGAEKLERLAISKNIALIRFGNRHDLGHWTGKHERVAILVTDRGFADRLMELYELQQDTEAKI